MKRALKHIAVGALWALPLAAFAQDPFGTGIISPIITTTLGTRDPRETVAAIINVALGFLGIVAVVIILMGGFTWMTAAGNEENVDKAKKLIFAGVVGLAIILSAYAIASFVLRELYAATRG